MNFIIYDVAFLIAFAAFVFFFLFAKRENLKREGLLFLYKAGWGIKLINAVGKRYKKTLNFLGYVSIVCGYALMAAMFYFFARIVYIYATMPSVVKEIKIPPITPLIPYLPQVFKLDFLPPFYFTYWIVIIAIIAIFHEFAHGIFAAHNKIKIKSTGFGFFPFFLPIFLAAFVELDEKRMAKKSIHGQLAILSAGTFANVLTAILFFGVLIAFFSLAFSPSGVIYDTYPYATIGISAITSVNGISVANPTHDQIAELANKSEFNEIKSGNREYVLTKDSLQQQKDKNNLMIYYDSPAIRAKLERVLLAVNGKEITSVGALERELANMRPNQTITLTVGGEDGTGYNRDVTLGENPESRNKAWLGIGFFQQQQKSGIIGKIYSAISSFKKPNVYYAPKFDGISVFIYNLLWWLVLISISVALVNMLPVGIFDGGRFFYLTILALTKSEKKAKMFFAVSTYAILFLVFIMMLFWILSLM